jgi:hypothetical protein
MLSFQAGVDGATSVGEGRRLLPVVAAMLALAALDLIGAALARSWSDHRSIVTLVGGMTVFSFLFIVYGKSLDYGELSTVTIGWIVFLQIGVVVLDRLNGVAIPPPKMTAIALILALQAYLTASDLS